VKDLVKAFDLFVRSKIRYSIYNIGGGPKNVLSLLELLNFLNEKLNERPEIKYSKWCPFDQRVYISDISKVKENLIGNQQYPLRKA